LLEAEMLNTCKKCGEDFRVLAAKPDAEFCSGCIEILVQDNVLVAADSPNGQYGPEPASRINHNKQQQRQRRYERKNKNHLTPVTCS
jgi:hypothetical protein